MTRDEAPRGYAGKRTVDVVLATIGLLITSPLFLIAGIAILFGSRRPLLFRQVRPGLRGDPFTLLKFRTMRPLSDGATDAARLTRVGRTLRSLSLDELPELWNVLRGDMSLVGPRPLLMEYLDRYTADQARRMDVKPGLTGLAQVEGRNALSWEDRFALDIWYVDNASFWLDLKIIAKTVGVVFRRHGISAEGEATMPEFMGTPSGSKQ